VVTVELGTASRLARDGEESGDGFAVVRGGHSVLIAVLDGLGHGPAAAAATARARATIEGHAELPLSRIAMHCHDALRETRGVAASLARVDIASATMAWLGVGNVAGLLIRADDLHHPRQASLLLRRGILGRTLPSLPAEVIAVTQGDTLIFATDGIDPAFALTAGPAEQPQALADTILRRYAREADDALVVVAAFRGGGS
jgi:hypothetical protein